MDSRINEALRIEERMRPSAVKVSMVALDQMKSKVVDLIRKNLAKSKSETFQRKPIIVFARNNEIATQLY